MSGTAKAAIIITAIIVVAYVGVNMTLLDEFKKGNKQGKGEELRTQAYTNVPSGPTDSQDFFGMLGGAAKREFDSFADLISGPMSTGNDPAYGTVNGGPQINRGKMDYGKEGIISYDDPMGKLTLA